VKKRQETIQMARTNYSKLSPSIHNYLFINTKRDTIKWLFQTNGNLIVDSDLLSLKDFLIYNENELPKVKGKP
jgi:hypothetical protein